MDRYVSDRNSWDFKRQFSLSLTRYDEFEKFWMSLSTPQTRLEISGFVYFHSKIKRIDCDSVKICTVFNTKEEQVSENLENCDTYYMDVPQYIIKIFSALVS